MNRGALSGLKVIEHAHFISGPFCAKLMADLGADVIKVEEPEVGDRARRNRPFLHDVAHSERSGLFLYLNTNKRGITLNLKNTTGRKVFKELIERADILVENNPPSVMKELDLDYKSLQRTNPGLIMTSITPFGQTGLYRDHKSSDLISFHMGGMGWITPDWVKDAAREPPLKGGGRQADFMTGVTAALATMGAFFARRSTGLGQHVDLSEQESVVYALARYVTHHFNGETDYRRAKAPTYERTVACKDGYIEFHVVEAVHWKAFKKVMGNPEALNDYKFKDYYSRCRNWDDLEPLVRKWAMEHTKEEICQSMQAERVALSPVNTTKDLLKSEQLAARGYFAGIDHPETGQISYPGVPYKFSRTPWQTNRPAPLLGQHNEEILCRQLGYTLQELTDMKESGIV